MSRSVGSYVHCYIISYLQCWYEQVWRLLCPLLYYLILTVLIWAGLSTPMSIAILSHAYSVDMSRFVDSYVHSYIISYLQCWYELVWRLLCPSIHYLILTVLIWAGLSTPMSIAILSHTYSVDMSSLDNSYVHHYIISCLQCWYELVWPLLCPSLHYLILTVLIWAGLLTPMSIAILSHTYSVDMSSLDDSYVHHYIISYLQCWYEQVWRLLCPSLYYLSVLGKLCILWPRQEFVSSCSSRWKDLVSEVGRWVVYHDIFLPENPDAAFYDLEVVPYNLLSENK